MDLGLEDLFNMSTTSELGELTPDQIVSFSASFKNVLTPPGHMQKDQAQGYLAQIVQLFGKDEIEVKLALGGWACIHDVGSVQSFADKEPIVVGTKSVVADKVFGEIIPVTVAGEPRKFCATMFEADIDVILRVFPQINNMLAGRCAQAGLPASDPKAVISFLKGVTTSTVGNNATRVKAKAVLIAQNRGSAQGGGAAVAAERGAQLAVREFQPSGHDLYGQI